MMANALLNHVQVLNTFCKPVIEALREEARITALHQQADTEHWHGQIFKRLEEA